jgi:hypothetical protein
VCAEEKEQTPAPKAGRPGRATENEKDETPAQPGGRHCLGEGILERGRKVFDMEGSNKLQRAPVAKESI